MFRLLLAVGCLLIFAPLKGLAQNTTPSPTITAKIPSLTPTAVPRVPFKEEQDTLPPIDPSDGLGFIPPVLDTATPTNLSRLESSLAAASTATPVTTPIPLAGTPLVSTPTVVLATPTLAITPVVTPKATSGK